MTIVLAILVIAIWTSALIVWTVRLTKNPITYRGQKSTEELRRIAESEFGDPSISLGGHMLWLEAVIELERRGIKFPNIEYGPYGPVACKR